MLYAPVISAVSYTHDCIHIFTAIIKGNQGYLSLIPDINVYFALTVLKHYRSKYLDRGTSERS